MPKIASSSSSAMPPPTTSTPPTRTSLSMAEKLMKLKQLKESSKQSAKLNKFKVLHPTAKAKDLSRPETQTEQVEGETQSQREKDGLYSLQDVERWNEKMSLKKEKESIGFSDYTAAAKKKYSSMIHGFKPDLEAYGAQMGASTIGDDGDGLQQEVLYASSTDQPSAAGLARLKAFMDQSQLKKKEFSRRRKVNEEEDVTFINERNMQFNKKISRAYDAYTKDIKDSFERGTAL